ncbi:MAG: cellulase family glycosylhydrolase [Planctomycetaceae bacterium]|nr:cellulase family glycosylhydrolase [Planctomycetaceae bacterium]
MKRRDFLKTAGTAIGTAPFLFRTGVPEAFAVPQQAVTSSTASGGYKNAIPRWRGFNLLDYFQAMGDRRANKVVREDDCSMIRDFGFDMVRLPMDYWFWNKTNWRETRRIAPDDLCVIDEAFLENIDKSIERLNERGIHASLNLHRAPGYCVNDPERESCSLWKDKIAEDAFAYHWEMFAKRYKGISNDKLSFNLINESPSAAPDDDEKRMTAEDYRRVMTRGTDAIRAISPDRLIIIDGLSYGNIVCEEMVSVKVAQSVHAYTPFELTHYRASWGDRNNAFPDPAWPSYRANGDVNWDRKRLEQHYAPWGDLIQRGIGVHCGEAGCYSRTPHDVMLAWLNDTLDILTGFDIGYSIWEFRGSFGIINSQRADVEYEDYHGCQLDRKMLEVLQKY